MRKTRIAPLVVLAIVVCIASAYGGSGDPVLQPVGTPQCSSGGLHWDIATTGNTDENTERDVVIAKVVAPSVNDAWALGEIANAATGDGVPIAYHWDGTSWKEGKPPKDVLTTASSPRNGAPRRGLPPVPKKNPGDSVDDIVSSPKGDNTWAIGEVVGYRLSTNSGPPIQGMSWHLVGNRWQPVPAYRWQRVAGHWKAVPVYPDANPFLRRSFQFDLLAVPDRSTAWAIASTPSAPAGQPLASAMLRSDGRRWTVSWDSLSKKVRRWQPESKGSAVNTWTAIEDLAVVGGKPRWAVGRILDNTAEPLLLGFNTTRWEQVTVPQLAGYHDFNTVTAVDDHDLFLGGQGVAAHARNC